MSNTTGNISIGANQRNKHAPDYQLLACVSIMVLFGLVMVYSSSFTEGLYDKGDSFYYMSRQLFAFVIGVIGLLVAQRIDFRRWQVYAFHIFVGAIILLFLTVLVLPAEITMVNNSRSWIRLGGFSIQPAELAKLALIIYMAAWLSQRGGRLKNLLTGTLPFAVSVGGVAGLIMVGRDLGTTTVVVVVAGLVFFIAGASLLHMLAAVALGMVSFLLAVNVAAYRLDRINAWLDPFAYYQGAGFQPTHALFALASGGILGEGLGQSREKYMWLPQSFTDTILAIIGEEFGLLGTLFVVACFTFFAYRGLKIAQQAPNGFAMLLAIGITLWMVVQAAINLAVVTTLVPFTGITLPFMSYGGTSLMVSLIAVGILLNISKYTYIDTVQHSIVGSVYVRFNALIAALPFFGRGNGRSRVSVNRSSRGPGSDR